VFLREAIDERLDSFTALEREFIE
jgi:hypothetical protein